jgi:hypothetical protein
MLSLIWIPARRSALAGMTSLVARLKIWIWTRLLFAYFSDTASREDGGNARASVKT